MTFLQSPEWEEIQKKMGRPTRRIGPVLVIKHDLPYCLNYLYAPRPGGLGEDFFPTVEEWARGGNALLLKVDPLLSWSSLARGVKSFPVQPRQVTVVDCHRSEEEILSRMHPKMRYNIRLAARRGVKVFRVSSGEALERLGGFLGLMGETAKRDKFSLHPEEHYRVLLEVMSGEFENALWLAEFEGRVMAGAMVNFFRPSSSATYLHGASSSEHRDVMAPHLLHWEIIREALRRGFASYDLGGVDERRWPGLSRFKKAFGGAMVEFPESRDFIYRPTLYGFYRFQKVLRRLI